MVDAGTVASQAMAVSAGNAVMVGAWASTTVMTWMLTDSLPQASVTRHVRAMFSPTQGSMLNRSASL